MAKAPIGSRIGKTVRKYLVTGVLVWLPIIVTLRIIAYIISTTDGLIDLIPTQWQPLNYFGFQIPGLGFVLAVAVLFVTGIFAANILGKKILEGWDSLLGRIPVVKSIYSGVKKISESLFSDNSRSFKTPVLVPFPQPGIWTLAFVSGSLPESIADALPQDEPHIPVYVPTTPNPTGGYYIMVRQSDVRKLDMSVDEALKYLISLGMVVPEQHTH